MNPLHAILIALGGLFLILCVISRRVAIIYLRYVVLTLAAAVILMPFFWLVCAAFKDKDVLMEYTFLPPISHWSKATLNLGNFRELFKGDSTPQGVVYFWRYMLNSTFLASTTTVIQVLLASMGGYALAKFEFPGKRVLTAFMLGTMMIPGMILLAPLYEEVFKLGWIDTYWALLVPGAVPVFGVFLFRQSMVGLSNELIEAARIDGAHEFAIYWNLVMPLVRPMTGAFCLVSFLGSWNSFLGPQIFILTQAKLTLPVILQQYMGIYSQQYGVYLAGSLLAILPPAIIFFALNKEFVGGLTTGAVKG